MTRDLAQLSHAAFDLLVIGGGIYGTTAAWDATQRGLSVALIDRGDFGGGTSFNSAKTLHGGVRELQSGRLSELRRFVRERRALSRIVPHLVSPLPFVIPTYRTVTRHRRLLQSYFAIHDLLAWDRNAGLDPARRLPSSRLLSRDECLARATLIDPSGVTGGIEWHDSQMYNGDRVNLAFLETAVRHGAVAANYVEAERLRRHDGRSTTVVARDRLTGDELAVSARVVLNCAGPWTFSLLRRLAPDVRAPLPSGLSVAMNIVVDRPLVDTHAVGAPSRGRLFFMAPWRGRTIVGTSHDPFVGEPDTLQPDERLVRQFLDDVARAFPGADLSLDDIALLHRGLLPAAVDGRSAPVALLKTSVVRDHAQDGLPCIISVLGVRYTTARDTAKRAIDAVFRVIGRTPPPCQTATTPLIGGDVADVHSFFAAVEVPGRVPGSVGERIARSYGTQGFALLARVEARPDDLRSLGTHCDVTRAEIRYATTDEMAVTLPDAILRRTEAGSGGHPGDDALHAAADVMAEELAWSSSRRDREIEAARAVYRWHESGSQP